MATTGDFYSSQADLCAEAAGATDLPMLRQKYEAAGAAWQALARREAEIVQGRADRRADEVARRSTESLAVT